MNARTTWTRLVILGLAGMLLGCGGGGNVDTWQRTLTVAGSAGGRGASVRLPLTAFDARQPISFEALYVEADARLRIRRWTMRRPSSSMPWPASTIRFEPGSRWSRWKTRSS